MRDCQHEKKSQMQKLSNSMFRAHGSRGVSEAERRRGPELQEGYLEGFVCTMPSIVKKKVKDLSELGVEGRKKHLLVVAVERARVPEALQKQTE